MCIIGWLRLVGSLKSLVSFAKEPYKRAYILQKRLIILRSLPIMATPHLKHVPLPPHTCMTTFSFSLCVAYHTCIVTCNVGHVALAHSLRTLATLVAHLLLSSHTCYSRRTPATLFAHLLLSSYFAGAYMCIISYMCVYHSTHARLEYHSSHICMSVSSRTCMSIISHMYMYVYHLTYARLEYHLTYVCLSHLK